MKEQTANFETLDEDEAERRRKNLMGAFLYMVPIYNGYIYANNNLKKHDLTKTQFRALVVAISMPGITMSDLADNIAISREQATRAVTPLVKRKLMTRTVDRMNRRQLNLKLTPEGHRFVYQLVEEFIETAEDKFKGLSQAEIDDFYNAVTTVSNTLGKLHRMDRRTAAAAERR